MMKTYRNACLILCVLGLAACTGPAQPPAAEAPGAKPVEPTATQAPAPDSTVVHTPPGAAKASQACMIAGEFKLMGQTIRSRDCVQADAASSKAELESICNGLAQTSAQMGGKAGEVTYMDACPSPSQGRCSGLFGRKYDGFYYERSAEDLTGLPASCALGGGTWSAG